MYNRTACVRVALWVPWLGWVCAWARVTQPDRVGAGVVSVPVWLLGYLPPPF